MTQDQLRELEDGDIVRNKKSGLAFIVIEKLAATSVLAVRTVKVSNPDEWVVVFKSKKTEEF